MGSPTMRLAFLSMARVIAASTGHNVVLFMLDDVDVASMDAMEDLDAMPTYSRLKATGTSWNRFFVQTPVCCPSRAQFLTGRLGHNTGFHANSLDTGCNSKGWQRDGEPGAIGPIARLHRVRPLTRARK